MSRESFHSIESLQSPQTELSNERVVQYQPGWCIPAHLPSGTGHLSRSHLPVLFTLLLYQKVLPAFSIPDETDNLIQWYSVVFNGIQWYSVAFNGIQ